MYIYILAIILRKNPEQQIILTVMAILINIENIRAALFLWESQTLRAAECESFQENCSTCIEKPERTTVVK